MLLNKLYTPMSFSSFPRVAFFFFVDFFVYILILLVTLFLILFAVHSYYNFNALYLFITSDIKELSINLEDMNSELDNCLYNLDDNVLRGDHVIQILPIEGKMFLSTDAKTCYFLGIKK